SVLAAIAPNPPEPLFRSQARSADTHQLRPERGDPRLGITEDIGDRASHPGGLGERAAVSDEGPRVADHGSQVAAQSVLPQGVNGLVVTGDPVAWQSGGYFDRQHVGSFD